MAVLYLILRLEPKANRSLFEKDREPPIRVFTRQHRGNLSRRQITEYAKEQGYYIPMMGGKWPDYDLLAVAYLSPNKDGKDRSGSGLFKMMARKQL